VNFGENFIFFRFEHPAFISKFGFLLKNAKNPFNVFITVTMVSSVILRAIPFKMGEGEGRMYVQFCTRGVTSEINFAQGVSRKSIFLYMVF